MNIKVQCCGIALLLILAYIYLRRRKMNLRTEKAFTVLFFITLVNLILDTLSIIALTYGDKLPDILVNVICKLYLISIVFTAFATYYYVAVDVLKNKIKSYKTRTTVVFTFAILSIIVISILPIYKFVGSANVVYTHGASVIATYFCCVSIIIYIVVLLWCNKAQMDIRRWESMRAWMILWIVSAFIQFNNNEFLLVGFAYALGIIVIYLKLENPEINYDVNMDVFSQEALLRYAEQTIAFGDDVAFLNIIFPYSLGAHATEYGGAFVNKQLADYFNSLPNILTFKKDDDELVLAFKNPKALDEQIESIRQRFSCGWGENEIININPQFIVMPDISMIEQEEDIFQIFKFARMHLKRNMSLNIIDVDDGILQEYYSEKHIEEMVADAMDKDRIQMFYQPIYSVREKRFASAEALVRIVDDDGTIVSPALFIDVAEKNGMIIRLGEMIFEKVCRFISENNPKKFGLDYIEINLSAIQCGYEHLADRFLEIMKKYNVKPEYVNLEITESASVDNKKNLKKNMDKLIANGVKFSLDDFGTGQSNLNYIVEMPVDIVKFDRGMVLDYFANSKTKYVMDAAMHMIHGLELNIVSEGIETKEQFDAMSDLGISYIQGYYFSKPLPNDKFLEFIKEKHTNK